MKNSDLLTLVITEVEPHSSIGRPKPMTDEDTEMSFDWMSEIPVSYLLSAIKMIGRRDAQIPAHCSVNIAQERSLGGFS